MWLWRFIVPCDICLYVRWAVNIYNIHVKLFCRYCLCFSIHWLNIVLLKWEALALLLIGISINQLKSSPEGSMALGLPVTTIAYVYTLIFVSDSASAVYFLQLLEFYLCIGSSKLPLRLPYYIHVSNNAGYCSFYGLSF